MLRRSGGSECAGDDTSLSPTRISPTVGSTKPAIRRSVVVLPQPDGPSRQTRLPCTIVSDTSSTTAFGPYFLVNLRNSTDATSPPAIDWDVDRTPQSIRLYRPFRINPPWAVALIEAGPQASATMSRLRLQPHGRCRSNGRRPDSRSAVRPAPGP